MNKKLLLLTSFACTVLVNTQLYSSFLFRKTIQQAFSKSEESSALTRSKQDKEDLNRQTLLATTAARIAPMAPMVAAQPTVVFSALKVISSVLPGAATVAAGVAAVGSAIEYVVTGKSTVATVANNTWGMDEKRLPPPVSDLSHSPCSSSLSMHPELQRDWGKEQQLARLRSNHSDKDWVDIPEGNKRGGPDDPKGPNNNKKDKKGKKNKDDDEKKPIRNMNKKKKKDIDEEDRKVSSVAKADACKKDFIKDNYTTDPDGRKVLKPGATPAEGATILEWDFKHGKGEWEAYKGKTWLGAIDPATGKLYKHANGVTRKLNVVAVIPIIQPKEEAPPSPKPAATLQQSIRPIWEDGDYSSSSSSSSRPSADIARAALSLNRATYSIRKK